MDWVVHVVKGPDQGMQQTLAAGQNIIGRGARAAVKLTPADISWEHVLITCNDNECIAENLSASGTYMDGTRITSPVRLRHRDQLRLSPETMVRFEAVGDDIVGRSHLLWWLVGVVAVLAVGFIAYTAIRNATAPVDNWDLAYDTLQTWVQAQQLPGDAAAVFRSAWRHEQVGDYKSSRQQWLRMQMLLDSLEDRCHFAVYARERPTALQHLLRPRQTDPPQDDEELKAALTQFVQRRASWSAAHSKETTPLK